jgi:DNA-binding beta-propeller fold protein YncE
MRQRPSVAEIVIVLLLLGWAAPPLEAQSANCNAPAKDPIVQLDMPGRPFEPVISADGCWIFVTLIAPNAGGRGSIAVVRRANGALHIARTVSLQGNPTGAVLTHDQKLLIVADGGYIAFLDVARLESGEGDPVLGYMGNGQPVGFIYVNVSADDRYLFASAERGAAILIADLQQERGSGFTMQWGMARLDVGVAPISVTLSPDGRLLYTTSEAAPQTWDWPKTCRPEAPSARGTQAPYHSQGVIILFDVGRAVSDPKHAELSRVAAGCNPVRLVLSPSGDVAYVSARDDDMLLAFDSQRLLSDTAHALLGRTEVGVAPVGVAVIDSGARVVVTNSNRFAGSASDRQKLAVVDASKLRAGAPAVVGTIPAGAFPRELRLTADGRTLFVTNAFSSTLEMIDLPRAAP